MKKLSHIKVLVVVMLIFSQCESIDDELSVEMIEIHFYDPSDPSTITNTAQGYFEFNQKTQQMEIVSSDLELVITINEETGEEIHGYIYKAEKPTMRQVKKNGRIEWEILKGYYGYGHSTGSYYYGTLVIDDDGNEQFIPASGTNAILNPPICPGDNSLIA